MNKYAKDFLKSEFQQFYADHIMKQVREGKDKNEINVDLSLSAMKEVGAKWLVKLYDYLKTRRMSSPMVLLKVVSYMYQRNEQIYWYMCRISVCTLPVYIY